MRSIKNRYRYSLILLRQLVKTDFKLRYQGSVLGYVWSLLRPLALFVILYFVFAIFLGIGGEIPHFSVYLLFGIILWNYFSEVTTGSVGAIVGRGDLLRKVSFPKYVIVLSSSVSALINLLLNFVIVGLFIFITHVDLRAIALLIPFLVIEMFIFSLAFAFFLSAAFVKFRDISFIWDVIMQGAFYLTPILYPLSTIHNIALQKIIMLNPMAQIIQDSRYVLVTDKSPTISSVYGSGLIRLVPVGITILLFVFAAMFFRKRSRYFAEDI